MYSDPVRLFTELYCGLLALQLVFRFREQSDFYKTAPQRLYGQPAPFLGILSLPCPNYIVFVISGLVLIASLTLAAVGIASRAMMTIAAIAFLLYFPPILPLGYIGRKANLIPVVLLACALLPSQCLLVSQVSVVMVYFSAGFEKLRSSGLHWAGGRPFQAYLIRHHLFSDNRGAEWLSRHISLCMALSTIVLAWELTFWLAIFFPSVTFAYVVIGILFHGATSYLMRIHYWIYFGPVYLAFIVPWLCLYR